MGKWEDVIHNLSSCDLLEIKLNEIKDSLTLRISIMEDNKNE